MHLVGTRGQQVRDFCYDASGTITTGGTAQLILPEQPNRTSLLIQNISSGPLFVELGGARATAVLTGNTLTSITVTNAGFNYTQAPFVKFMGGGDISKNPTYLGPGLPGGIMPGLLPQAHCVMSSSAIAGKQVASIVIDNPGGPYFAKPPYVLLQSSDQDPFGVALPSGTLGIELGASGSGSLLYSGTPIPTDAISIYGATTGQAFTVKYTIGG